ncbi:ANR family transcriptional regulator [Enterobacter mori]
MVSDEIAEHLEKEGLWRRAATRWLDVMLLCENSAEREWLSQRRRYCYEKSAHPAQSEKLGISGISRAATRTQERMGISLPGGAAFRRKQR